MNEPPVDRPSGDLPYPLDQTEDPDQAVSPQELQRLREILLDTQPWLEASLWERLIRTATDSATPDPGVALVEGTAGADAPFPVHQAADDRTIDAGNHDLVQADDVPLPDGPVVEEDDWAPGFPDVPLTTDEPAHAVRDDPGADDGYDGEAE